MDPHSRRSQYNQRQPKAGPQARTLSSMPLPTSPTLNTLAGPSALVSFGEKRATKSKSKAPVPTIRRPIASNSRIRQGENLRRDMYLAFVNNALQEKAEGRSGPFDELVNQFNFKSNATSVPSQIRFWISALSHVVSKLERTHSALVEAIVNMPWTLLDDATVRLYTVFIGMLLSARPEYLSLVLGKIVQGFTHQSSIQVLDLSPPVPSSSSSPPAKALTRRVIYDRLHYLLAHILSLIPTLPSTLQPLLVKHFPHKRQNHFAQLTYIRNILRVSAYCPELSDKILATIVDRAIQIDVEIQVELEELEDDDNDNGLPDHDLFELDPFDVLVGQEGEGFDSDAEDALSDAQSDDEDGAFSDISSDAGEEDLDKEHIELPTNVKHIQEMVKKLDGILALVFQHFQKGLEEFAPLQRTQSLTALNDIATTSPTKLPPLPTPYSQSIYPSISTVSMPATPIPPLPNSFIPPLEPVTPKAVNSPSKSDYLRSQFYALLSIFERTILNTFKSRYTQFLVFWYASLDPEFVDVFQGTLVERALYGPSEPANQGSGASGSTNTTPELTRAAAASYIGSFVSRAKFVDRESTRSVVGVLCQYLQAYLDDVDEALRMYTETNGELGSAVGAPSQHVVFYAVAQAVLLIFCFRWRELVIDYDEEEEMLKHARRPGADPHSISISARVRKDKWIPELSVLKRVVMSVLNPLKVCSPGVVSQFARVAHQTDFVYCYSILESNKRSSPSARMSMGGAGGNSVSAANGGPSLSHYASNGNGSTAGSHSLMHPTFLRGELNNELNTFFPFDPYRLPKSGSFIQEVYREWEDVAIEGDEDSDADEDDEDSDEDSSDDGGSHTSASSGFLAIPIGRKRVDGNDGEATDGGLGESLNAMSISPAYKMALEEKVAGSVGSAMAVSISYR
ncbi:hypothetical protein D9611_002662 [Ephemerocybe angulata]|uniref:RNA polymerase I-specific transcription initiation factor RRN3 n=1 Tax=Ephemerocybe angulata TaxID=980116 RepID=A0A8H5C211_9AGAR|nr:hypothetical protein D9611_002662 [Tulosesus angulatus]